VGLIGVELDFGHEFADGIETLVDRGNIHLLHHESRTDLIEPADLQKLDDMIALRELCYFGV
jgi:hypothetical protein